MGVSSECKVKSLDVTPGESWLNWIIPACPLQDPKQREFESLHCQEIIMSAPMQHHTHPQPIIVDAAQETDPNDVTFDVDDYVSPSPTHSSDVSSEESESAVETGEEPEFG